MLAAAVTPRALPRTMALSSSTWQGALIVGPLLGGAFQALGDVPPYAAAMLLEATAGILVLTVTRRIGTDHKVVDAPPVTLRDATAGLRFIIATPALLAAISLDLVAVLFGGATALLPVVAQDILHVGEVGYGVLRAAPGVGAAERVFIGASNELGAFESGTLARFIGTVPAILVGGVTSVAIAGLWFVLFPSLRRIDRFEDVAADPAAPR
jgi:hypothetical protein